MFDFFVVVEILNFLNFDFFVLNIFFANDYFVDDFENSNRTKFQKNMIEKKNISTDFFEEDNTTFVFNFDVFFFDNCFFFLLKFEF